MSKLDKDIEKYFLPSLKAAKIRKNMLCKVFGTHIQYRRECLN